MPRFEMPQPKKEGFMEGYNIRRDIRNDAEEEVKRLEKEAETLQEKVEAGDRTSLNALLKMQKKLSAAEVDFLKKDAEANIWCETGMSFKELMKSGAEKSAKIGSGELSEEEIAWFKKE